MPCGLTSGSWLLDDGRSPAVVTLQFIGLFTTSGNGPYPRKMCLGLKGLYIWVLQTQSSGIQPTGVFKQITHAEARYLAHCPCCFPCKKKGVLNTKAVKRVVLFLIFLNL